MTPPEIDPAGIAQAAMDSYDADKNGSLSKSELAKCPGLLSALAEYDTDKNNAISAEEISTRMQKTLDSGIGRLEFTVRVLSQGRTVQNAVVKFVPDPIMGGAILPAEGTTDYDGNASPVANPSDGLPGIQFGIYRVEITHPQLKLPAKYNTSTTLGVEVSPLSRENTVDFKL
ncbi:MAG: hypothetical protein KDA99_26260 [Planctomycetales bacterium]|nr:hypothetical protein [Planctomycetales bacterium]